MSCLDANQKWPKLQQITRITCRNDLGIVTTPVQYCSIACYKNGPRLDAEMRNKIATSLEEILWEENVSSVNQNYMGQIFRHSYAESGRIHGMKY